MLLHGTCELPMWNSLCNFPILEDVDKEVLIPFFSFGSVLFRVFCYLSFEHYDFLLIFPTLNADTKCSERL